MPWLWTMDFEKLIHTPNIPYFNPRSNPILSLFRSLKDNTSKASSPKIYLKVKESLSKTFYIPLSTPYEQLLCVAVAPACDWSTLKRSFSKVFGKNRWNPWQKIQHSSEQPIWAALCCGCAGLRLVDAEEGRAAALSRSGGPSCAAHSNTFTSLRNKEITSCKSVTLVQAL